MDDKTIALYKKALGVLSKKPRDITALDRETVKTFIADATSSDSRMQHFELAICASATLGGDKGLATLVKNLDRIGQAMVSFTEGKPVSAQIRKLLPQYMQQWVRLAESEAALYQGYIQSRKKMRKLFQNAS